MVVWLGWTQVMHVDPWKQCLTCINDSVDFNCYDTFILIVVNCSGCLVAYLTVIPSSFLPLQKPKMQSIHPLALLTSWAWVCDPIWGNRTRMGVYQRLLGKSSPSDKDRKMERDVGHWHGERRCRELWQPFCDTRAELTEKSVCGRCQSGKMEESGIFMTLLSCCPNRGTSYLRTLSDSIWNVLIMKATFCWYEPLKLFHCTYYYRNLCCVTIERNRQCQGGNPGLLEAWVSGILRSTSYGPAPTPTLVHISTRAGCQLRS